MEKLFIGLMSGTSMDGIDAAIVNFSSGVANLNKGESRVKLIETHHLPMPDDIHQQLTQLSFPGENEIFRFGQLDVKMGRLFAKACLELLEKSKLSPTKILAIGSHGQTIRHHPHGAFPFTMQIGDPNIIAEETGITTIADFRRRDMALGGQGAPLTPGFHSFAFYSSTYHRIILNIGGIANITLLNKDKKLPVIGFDTGPGNTLLDCWAYTHLHTRYDDRGHFAAQGQVHSGLLEILLEDDYFKQTWPKSSGKEYFNLAWLQQKLAKLPSSNTIAVCDIQCTLLELTARTIMQAINSSHFEPADIVICGGGIHNTALFNRLNDLKGHHTLFSSDKLGVNPQWVEVAAFAWMANQTLNAAPSNIPSVTGANKYSVLGGIYL